MSDLKITVDITELTGLINTTQQTKQTIKLLATEFARTGNQSAYMRGLNQINNAQRNLDASSRMSRSEIMKVGNEMRKQARFTDQLKLAQGQLNANNRQLIASNSALAGSYRATGAAAQIATRATNRNGMVMQQVGYQAGDFLVQIQSGTNAMVAFGQQATQLAGLMGVYSSSLIGVGAALGILIPIATAVGAALMRTSGAGKSLTQRVDDLVESTSNLGEGFRRLADPDIEQQFGSMTDSVESITEAMMGLNKISAQLDLASTISSVQGSASASFWQQLLQGAINIPNAIDPFADMISASELDQQVYEQLGFQMARDTFLGFTEEMERLANAGDLEGVVETFAEFMQDATDGGAALQEVTGPGRQIALEMERAMIATARWVAELDGSAEAARVAADLAEDMADFYEDQEKSAERLREKEAERLEDNLIFLEDAQRALAEEAALQGLINELGEGSLEVTKLRAEQARGIYELELLNRNLTADQVEQTMALYDALQDVNSGGEVLRATLERIMNLNSNNTVNAIIAITRELGIATDQAILLARSMPGYSGGGASGPDAVIADQRDAIAGTRTTRTFTGEDFRSSGGGVGGGQEIESLQEIIQARRDQIELERELLGLSSEARAVREVAIALEADYKGELDATGRAAIQAAAVQIAAYEQVTQAIEDQIAQQERIADIMSNSFGDAFTSIIDGTKSAEEAFKDMARQIISELFEILVVQRLVGQIGGALGGGGGGLGAIFGGLFGGNRASGGTVMGNTPYLVGERGPELVIPGSRGTVMNSDLTNKSMSGSQPVNVTQVFNINGNGDDYIVGKIREAAPSIARATESQILDNRRRGGAYKSVFG